MLRGPQTPGELKQRTDRLHPFADLAAVEDTLLGLIDRELVRGVERRPGQKEQRFEQLLGGVVGDVEPAPAPDPAPEPDRLARLEAEVAELRRELTALKQELGT